MLDKGDTGRVAELNISWLYTNVTVHFVEGLSSLLSLHAGSELIFCSSEPRGYVRSYSRDGL